MKKSIFVHKSHDGSFVKSITKYLKNLTVLSGVLLLLVTALTISQIERFINNGTLFGYQVRRTAGSTQVLTGRTALGGLGAATQMSVACKKVTQSDVSKALKTDVEAAQSFLGDRQVPNLISSCIYRTSTDPKKNIPLRTTSILYREYDSDTIAKQSLASTQKRSGVDTLKLGDEAYYVDVMNQLTVRKGKNTVVITISKATGNVPQSKDAAVILSKSALGL